MDTGRSKPTSGPAGEDGVIRITTALSLKVNVRSSGRGRRVEVQVEEAADVEVDVVEKDRIWRGLRASGAG